MESSIEQSDILGAISLGRVRITPTGCMVLRGTKPGRYSTISIDGEPLLITRLVCTIFHRRMKRHEQACHTCDNPPCFRPDHLFIGTRSDNAKDMVAKGRHRGGNPRKAPSLRSRNAGLSFSPSVVKRLQDEAVARGISKSALVQEILRDHFAKFETQEASN